MTAPYTATYDDVLTILRAFAAAHGSSAGSSSQDIMRYCVEAALREIVSARDWTCLRKLHRIALQAPYTTGTATYAATGGAADYLVTISGGVTASWMEDGQLRIGSYETPCDIDQVLTSTTFTLRPPRVPTEDITTATAFTIGRAWYELPAEFVASWAPAERNAWFIGEYVPFDQWHLLEKYRGITGTVRRWSIGPAPNRYGTTALYVDPWPSATSDVDFVMKCRPRQMVVSGQDAWNYAGTVTVAESGTTVTGASTQFRSTMAGSIIRFSDGATKPTGTHGSNPYIFQQSISAVDTDAQTLTLASAAPVALSGVKCVVADPLDLDIGLYDAFLRNCEKQLAHATGMKDMSVVERQYQIALTAAKIADAQNRQRDTAGGGHRYYTRLSDQYVRT